jgi:microcystin-dependent protein
MPGGGGAPFVGQIMMVGFNFAPVGWEFCDGQLLPISEYEALYNLIGTTYGGDGVQTFGLPDLRGRVPVHQGQGVASTFVIGEPSGAEQVTLTVNELPAHQHLVSPGASQNEPTSDVPNGNYPALGGYYAATTTSAPMGASTVSATGSGQPHTNIQPFLGINFIISLFGIFPSPS